MFHLVKKNSSYVIQLVILLPFLAVAWFIKREPLSTFQIFMGGMWMVLTVLGGMINGEQIEERSKGYEFLRILPIKDKDIVASKFFMAFFSAVVVVGYLNILLLFLSGPPYLFSLGRIVIFLFAAFVLLLVALLYILAYRIGFSRFVKAAWTVFFVIILLPILFMEFVLRKLDVDYEEVFESILMLPWIIWILLGLGLLVVYFSLMAVAVRAMKSDRRRC